MCAMMLLSNRVSSKQTLSVCFTAFIHSTDDFVRKNWNHWRKHLILIIVLVELKYYLFTVNMLIFDRVSLLQNIIYNLAAQVFTKCKFLVWRAPSRGHWYISFHSPRFGESRILWISDSRMWNSFSWSLLNIITHLGEMVGGRLVWHCCMILTEI